MHARATSTSRPFAHRHRTRTVKRNHLHHPRACHHHRCRTRGTASTFPKIATVFSRNASGARYHARAPGRASRARLSYCANAQRHARAKEGENINSKRPECVSRFLKRPGMCAPPGPRVPESRAPRPGHDRRSRKFRSRTVGAWLNLMHHQLFINHVRHI